MKKLADLCVLLFSGGRDSTIAAVRLSCHFEKLVLVTVTSEHLIGIASVRRRLGELKSHLPKTTQWLHVIQPTTMPGDQLFRAQTCLPCHRAYAAIGATVAKRFKANSVAFGYTKYQSTWPEQTPFAIQRLAFVLTTCGIGLELPVYDIASKSEAIAELSKYGLTIEALEQKCLRQQFNVALDPARLEKEISAWEQATVQSMAVLSQLQIEIVSEFPLGELSEQG